MGSRKKRFRATRVGADWTMLKRTKAFKNAERDRIGQHLQRSQSQALALLNAGTGLIERTPA